MTRNKNVLVHLEYTNQSSQNMSISVDFPVGKIKVKEVSIDGTGLGPFYGVVKSNLVGNEPVAIINQNANENPYSPVRNMVYNTQSLMIQGDYTFDIVDFANQPLHNFTGDIVIILEFEEVEN